jgi:hypothetical protein
MGYIPVLYPLTLKEFQPLLLSYICGGPRATDPRDYVYGILGLFESPPVTVDYALTPKQLYINVIKEVQQRTGKLDFLSWARGSHVDASQPYTNPHGLPSWAIDFSYRTRFVTPIPLANSSQEQRLIWDTFYAASKITTQQLRYDDGKDSFASKGIRVDEIISIGTLADTSSSNTIWPQDWCSLGDLGALSAPDRQRANRDKHDGLAMWSLSGLPHDHTAAQLERWWRTLYGDTVSREARIDKSDEDKAAVPPRDRSGVEDLCRQLTEYLQIQVHNGRRMFRTVEGRLGLAPPAASVGDTVCILYGGDVPYVLNPAPDGDWYFMGEWHVSRQSPLQIQVVRLTRTTVTSTA